MEFALKKLPKEEFQKPKDLYTYNITKTSGKLATENTPKDQVVSTIMAVKLEEYDDGFKEMKIDTLCNGPVSENTPEESIKTIYIPNSKPVIDGYDPEWTRGFFEALKMGGTGTGTTTSDTTTPTLSDTPCERPGGPGDVSITIDVVGNNDATLAGSGKRTIEVGWLGNRDISTLRVSSNGELKREVSYGTGAKSTGKERIAMNIPDGSITIDVEAVDRYGFKYTESKTLIV